MPLAASFRRDLRNEAALWASDARCGGGADQAQADEDEGDADEAVEDAADLGQGGHEGLPLFALRSSRLAGLVHLDDV